MNTLIINFDEFTALNGLPHLQQLAYLRGIRPYMDTRTGIVGILRAISLQSIADHLHVKPQSGIKSQNFSRDQIRRVLSGLVRVGIISIQSEDRQLILKCNLATLSHSVQNKAAINPPQKATTNPPEQNLVDTGFSGIGPEKAAIGEPLKAATTIFNNNIYIYLLSRFEEFWSLYPEQKSKPQALKQFELLNPDESLFQKLMEALHNQIAHFSAMKTQGLWTPPWKYPANWLANRCWEDGITMDFLQETSHAAHAKHTRKNEPARDPFCPPEQDSDAESNPSSNVIPFRQHSG